MATASGSAALPQRRTDRGPSPEAPAAGPASPDWCGDRTALVRLAHRFVWSPDDAEDIVQDALLQARESGEQLRDPRRAQAWLRRIVVRRALLHIRQARRRRRAIESAGRTRGDPPADPAHTAARREQLARLRNAIESLPPQQQAAVTLRHLEGMGYAEIAEIMEIAEATVRFHVRRARLALAAKLGAR